MFFFLRILFFLMLVSFFYLILIRPNSNGAMLKNSYFIELVILCKQCCNIITGIQRSKIKK